MLCALATCSLGPRPSEVVRFMCPPLLASPFYANFKTQENISQVSSLGLSGLELLLSLDVIAYLSLDWDGFERLCDLTD